MITCTVKIAWSMKFGSEINSCVCLLKNVESTKRSLYIVDLNFSKRITKNPTSIV